MDFHPLSNLFPLMHGREFEELVTDIKTNGLREPIWVLDDQILDGRNRYLACNSAGVHPIFHAYEGGDPLAFVLSLNLHRRHLNPGQLAFVALEIERVEAQLAKGRQGSRTDIQERIPESDSGQARDKAAAAVGVNGRYVSDAKRLEREAPELAARVKAGDISLPAAKLQARDDANKARLREPAFVEFPPGLRIGDFRSLVSEIADSSVELVFTDPPYDRESLGLYEDAAREAARILKPGGSFIAYCGHYLMPEILATCGKHLRYFWLLAANHSGRLTRMNRYGIVVNWKPLVWFVKDQRGDIQTFVDDLVSGGREKSHHPWQQSEAEAAYYIEKLTSPRGLVVDFFAGGGTTLLAAEKLGRPWVGFEIDPSQATKISGRLLEAA